MVITSPNLENQSSGTAPTVLGSSEDQKKANAPNESRIHESKSTSWSGRLRAARSLVTKFPQLSDIKDTERLAILSRIPPQLKQRVFESGKIQIYGERFDIRTTQRTKLSRIVTKLRVDIGPDISPSALDELHLAVLRVLDELRSSPSTHPVKRLLQQLEREAAKRIGR